MAGLAGTLETKVIQPGNPIRRAFDVKSFCEFFFF